MPKGDGGHWPKGVRRNPEHPDWPDAVKKLKKLLQYPVRGRVSRRAMAVYCGVHECTVRKWLNGTSVPTKASTIRVFRWLKKVDPS